MASCKAAARLAASLASSLALAASAAAAAAAASAAALPRVASLSLPFRAEFSSLSSLWKRVRGLNVVKIYTLRHQTGYCSIYVQKSTCSTCSSQFAVLGFVARLPHPFFRKVCLKGSGTASNHAGNFKLYSD